MEFGLIGEHLGHSFSKEIHEGIAAYEYVLKEVQRPELRSFMESRDFKAINVTVPYKEAVIPFLDEISPEALSIGAVNTVVNRDGRLIGYNTDYNGFRALLHRNNISPAGKNVLVLGYGGAAKAVAKVAKDEGACSMDFAVRHNCDDTHLPYVSLEDRYEIIINATPCGMYPDIEAAPFDIRRFSRAEAFLDCIYNPLRTKAVLEAQYMGIKAEGGLYMLVSQAVHAIEKFLGRQLDHHTAEDCYSRVVQDKENIVLIGMPSCGKTTVGRALSSLTGRPFIDTDEEIILRTGITIPQYFSLNGESGFRKIESEVISSLSSRTGLIIATGGGAIVSKENVQNLKMNGKIIYLDTKIDNLVPTADRPLTDSIRHLQDIYIEREPLYRKAADCTIDNNCDEEESAKRILAALRSAGWAEPVNNN